MASEWTVDTLKEHLDAVLAERDKAVSAALAAAEKAVTAALLAADRAVAKAESAAEKRFESVNEFRGQLADQAKTFMPRSEYDARHASLVESVAILSARMDRSEGKLMGVSEQRTLSAGMVGMFVTIGGLVLAVVVFLLSRGG